MVFDEKETPSPPADAAEMTEIAGEAESIATRQVESGKDQVSEIEALQEALQEQTAKAEEHLDQWRRTAADFANYRKRQDKERQDQISWARANLLLSFLPVLDDLERALDELPEEAAESNWSSGIELVVRKMHAVLAKAGLQEIEVEAGQLFDPNFHEAVLYEENTAYPEGSVVQVLQKGYTLDGKVLRAAMVSVSKAVAEAAPVSTEDR